MNISLSTYCVSGTSQILHYIASIMNSYDMFVTVKKSTCMCGLLHFNYLDVCLPPPPR